MLYSANIRFVGQAGWPVTSGLYGDKRRKNFAIPRNLIFADLGAENTRSCIALLSYTYFLFLMNYY